MTAVERALLLQVSRWARAEGVRLDGAMRWTSPPPHRWGVDWWGENEPDDATPMVVWRKGTSTGKSYWVASIAEAVDVLCALGILPARFSTSYRAGWDAMSGYAERAHYGAEFAAIRPAVQREPVLP